MFQDVLIFLHIIFIDFWSPWMLANTAYSISKSLFSCCEKVFIFIDCWPPKMTPKALKSMIIDLLKVEAFLFLFVFAFCVNDGFASVKPLVVRVPLSAMLFENSRFSNDTFPQTPTRIRLPVICYGPSRSTWKLKVRRISGESLVFSNLIWMSFLRFSDILYFGV